MRTAASRTGSTGGRCCTDPVTVRGYERLQTLLDAYGEEDGTVNSADSEEPAANLHTLLLPGGDVGYVKIDSFPAEYEDSYATDRAALTDFYRQARTARISSST